MKRGCEMTNDASLIEALRAQRSALQVEPIHAHADPVRAYAKQIAELKGEPFSVIKLPKGSAAYRMGYRFASIPDSELPYYLANGAVLT